MQRRTFLNLAASGVASVGVHQVVPGADVPIAQPASNPAPGILTVGHRKQRFLDDELIAARSRLSKFMGQPEKLGPVITADRAWELDNSDAGGYDLEGVQICGQAVMFDEDEQCFKMWYNPWAFFDKRYRPWCYAISKDGLHWEKPSLGIYSYRDSKENNILWAIDGAKYFNVMKDLKESDPQKRYKAMGENEVKGNSGLAVAFSPDGLHWTEHPGNSVVRKGRDIADSPTMLGWDDRIRKYVYYPRPGPPLATRIDGRGYHESPDRVNLNEGQLRTIGYSTSDDFIHWSPTELMLAPDDFDRVDFQYYQMTTARDGDHYIGLMHMLQTHEQTFDIYLLTSRDGFRWNWIHRELPFLRRGEPGTFDDGYLTPSGPIVHQGQIWIYYGAYSGSHSVEPNKLGANRMTIGLAKLSIATSDCWPVPAWEPS